MTLATAASPAVEEVSAPSSSTKICNAAIESDNPLLRSWSDQPFNLPPFKDIRAEHFVPAFEIAMAAHLADLNMIAFSPSDDFDAILGMYDRAGGLLSKVGSVYGNYTSSLNTPDM